MKTIKFRLLATMLTLAAITITTTIPANAQRRSSERNTASRVENSDRSRKNTVQKKSTFKDYDTKPRSTRSTSVESSRNIQRNSNPAAVQKRSSSTHSSVSKQTQPNKRRTTVNRTPHSTDRIKNGTITKNRTTTPKPAARSSARTNENKSKTPSNSGRITNRTEMRDRSTTRAARAETRSNAVRNSTRNKSVNNREFYRHDVKDRRYTPDRNYRGTDKAWTNSYRSRNMVYNRNDRNFHRKYNYNKYKHWDRSWERYRWNHNSWRDYYNGYHPYSYRWHNHYYHHPRWGHVIKRWNVRPYVFIHNHQRYYCYNGHFFRHRPGVGYILVDMPFGLVFEYLPHGYERVYINGYLYFRVGNLFFEYSRYGFRLVHYPERYFAYNDGYYNQGYRFDDYYYHDDYYYF